MKLTMKNLGYAICILIALWAANGIIKVLYSVPLESQNTITYIGVTSRVTWIIDLISAGLLVIASVSGLYGKKWAYKSVIGILVFQICFGLLFGDFITLALLIVPLFLLLIDKKSK